ncbi:MAG TPA: quinone-dependent dihydroorotate dehydrogenase [Stellaceae bacterium]|nr:quinone-dependent dihydroorotate dehydrogenase [Stellaceae bacterium]
MANFYRVIRPLLWTLSAERAHGLTLRALETGLVGSAPGPDPDSLSQTLWGLDFPNPIGLAAGFDKDARVPDAMLRLGFGFTEIGTVTPRPQPGNPRPRVFRLPADDALINRLGFNSGGLDGAIARLGGRPRHGIVGVNVGKNRDSTDAVADYVEGVRRTAALADYLVMNISSPNTPGLRDLQARAALDTLIEAVLTARRETGATPPLLVKIAPDLGPAEAADIAEVATARGIDGIVVGNTTIARPPALKSRDAGEAGGLSGKPLFARSTELLAEMYRLTGGAVPLVGVGGVASAADAYAKIGAGASLVQLYTGLVFGGPALLGEIKSGLSRMIERDGFASVAEAVGSGAR